MVSILLKWLLQTQTGHTLHSYNNLYYLNTFISFLNRFKTNPVLGTGLVSTFMQVIIPSDLSIIPQKLRPTILRSGAKFQDLKEYLFKEEEILWLCEEMDKKHEPWE